MAAALCSTRSPGLGVTVGDGIHGSPVVKGCKGRSSLYTKSRRCEQQSGEQYVLPDLAFSQRHKTSKDF